MLTADGGGGRTSGASLTVNHVKMMIAPEEIEATAQRLSDIAGELSGALGLAFTKMATRPPGTDPASALASSNVLASTTSAADVVQQAITQLELAASNLRQNTSQIVTRDESF